MPNSIKIFILFMIIALGLGAAVWFFKQPEQKMDPDAKVVAITQIVAHPALNALREGIEKGLSQAGWEKGRNLQIIYDNAQGSIATANQIAHKFAGLDADVIVAISTASAQTVIATVRQKGTPVVFGAVTYPLDAKLVENIEHPGGHVTGTTDHPPVAQQLELFAEIMADKNPLKLGVLYNAGEANSVAQVAIIRKEAAKRGIQIITRSVDNTTKVFDAAKNLVPEVDAFYIPLDNTVMSALQAVLRAGLGLVEGKYIPTFASDPEQVFGGAVATIGFTHYDEGLLSAQIIDRILRGENPGDIPVQTPKIAKIHLNLKMAEKVGITIPKELIQRAAKPHEKPK